MNQTYINELKNHIGEEVTLERLALQLAFERQTRFFTIARRHGNRAVRRFQRNDEEVFEKRKALGQESSLSFTAKSKKTRARRSASNLT
jgi:hypothetical protein